MKNFPITCVDDFLKYPDTIVGWLMKQEYKETKDGKYPGGRTLDLGEINPKFSQPFIEKVLSVYFNLNNDYLLWEELNMRGSTIPKLTKNRNDKRNRSWIHRDFNIQDIENTNAFAGVIYLNKNVKYHDSGTSFFKPIRTITQDEISKAVSLKEKFYLKQEIDIDEYCSYKDKYEKKFIKSGSFKNFYNRLVVFPLDVWHRIDNYDVGAGEDRLTISFWMGKIINSPMYPLEKVYKYDL